MTSFPSEDGNEEELSLSSLRISGSLRRDEEGEESSDGFEYQSPLEQHMVRLFSTSLSDISTVSLVSDNARSVVSPQQMDPKSRLMRPQFSKSLSDRKIRLCRWSSESSPQTGGRPTYNASKARKGSKSSPMADQMAADMSRWKNCAPSLPKRPVERLFLRQNSDSVLMRPERTGSSSSLSSTNSSTSFSSDMEDDITPAVAKRNKP